MNLQVASPFVKCPFNCPFCIANSETPKPLFNLYDYDKEAYLDLLKASAQGKDTIVISGDTEPTLFPEWLNDVIKALPNHKIELTTANHNYKAIAHEFVSHSYYQIPTTIPQNPDRATIILNKKIDVIQLIDFINMQQFKQYTIKYLMPSFTENARVNEWINSNKVVFNTLQESIITYLNVRIDKNCMESGRYTVFRIDGIERNGWEY